MTPRSTIWDADGSGAWPLLLEAIAVGPDNHEAANLECLTDAARSTDGHQAGVRPDDATERRGHVPIIRNLT